MHVEYFETRKLVEIEDILHTEDLDIGNLDFVRFVPTSPAEVETDFQNL